MNYKRAWELYHMGTAHRVLFVFRSKRKDFTSKKREEIIGFVDGYRIQAVPSGSYSPDDFKKVRHAKESDILKLFGVV